MKHTGWLVTLIIGSGPALIAAACTPPIDLEAEEYAVYSALIESQYIQSGIDQIVIQNQTATGLGDRAEVSDYVKQNLPELSSEMIADFGSKNQQPRSFQDRFRLTVKCVLVSSDDVKQIFQNGKGWDTFYAKYPHSQGLMTLSRVGFNAKLDKAIVYVGNQSHWLAGAGYFVMLTKANGTWAIQNEIMVWIS